jgi:hypothetical protein
MAADFGLEYLIPVLFDPLAHTLTIQHPDLSLRPGDRVIWDFAGIPEGWTPWIQFKPEKGPRDFLGPFASISQIERGVWAATAADAQPSSFTYRASIQKGLGLDWTVQSSVLVSGQASITVHTEPVIPAALFRVSPRQEGSGALQVEPESQPLRTGQGVIWKFEGFSADPVEWGQWRPRVDFGRYEGTGKVSNQALGPFTCLMYEERQVTGLGNSGVLGEYHFQVSLISIATGEIRWVNSGDPAVDNQGPAWNPVSGGPPGG